MFGIFTFLFVVIMAVPALIFSILSWRLRTAPMFWLGVVFTGLLLIYYFFNFGLFLLLFHTETFLPGLFTVATIAIPAYFLISSKISHSSSAYGESGITDDYTDASNNRRSSKQVTEDYLNKIIESEDEEIDYEN